MIYTDNMQRRLKRIGGRDQQDRMIKLKEKSLLSAIGHSYQSAEIKKYPHFKKVDKALLNSRSITEDYDNKMISIPFFEGYRTGDVFYHVNTRTYWIIFLQELTELAYFKGYCRRCNYVVSWIDKFQRKHTSPIAVIGPNNPILGERQVSEVRVSIPSANLKILISDTKENQQYFQIGQVFLLKGVAYKVSELDNLSMPGIIQLSAIQTYADQGTSEMNTNTSNAFSVHPVVEHLDKEYGIEGPREIGAQEIVEYRRATYVSNALWNVKEKDVPVVFKEDESNPVIHLQWTGVESGKFTLQVLTPDGDLGKEPLSEKIIYVNSLL